MKNRISLLILLAISFSIHAQKVMRIGIIGLDTSHSTAFTELINSGSDETFSKGFRVVAAYPYGSKTIQSSYERIPGYIEKVKANGVEITSSIADLLEKVDCVLLETNDGRLHLEQAVEVFKSGKICYIDKPVGATLGDAIAIYEMAEKYNAPVFSSSALRFTPQNQKLRNGEFGKILGADCYSPHKVEPTHPDFGFYGIHGVETLYTIMGTGCESVNRMSSDRGDVVVGRWKDGRIGTFRAIALFYLGKSLHEQGTKERGYVYMLQATEMMEKSHYDRKYDNLRANCNDLLICYERDKRYGEALQVLDKLEKYLYAKTPGEAEMEGLYEQEKCKWLAHRAVVCSKLGKEKEANEAYSEFQKMGRINRRYAYLVVPYLFDLHRYDEIVDMCKQRETEMMHKKDTINLYMSSTLKFYGMAYQGLEQYDKAASYFERLSVLRDSLRVRELRSSSQELSIIYDVKDKEAQITHQRWELVIAICILIALAIIGCVLGYNNRIIRKKNISLVANVKEAMRYKEELEKLNRSTLSENIAWNDDEDPDLLLFEQIKVKIIDQKFFLDNTFSRKALMGEFNIPANKFAGLFRQFTGKSFSEYINDLRIEYVAELLLSGKYASVEELLKECTFISSTSLYRLFTKKYGMTPQKFLRNARLC